MITAPTRRSLGGLRVLDLSRVLAAPLAAQILGDLGADVIKVERPGRGDLGRLYGRSAVATDSSNARDSSFYVCANRNKRSITVNLQNDGGQQIVRQLAAQSDVLIENFVGDTLQRLGLDYESLRSVNERLVYCSVTGYGHDSPYADRPGYDAVFQAHGGLMSVTGLPDGVPGAGPMKTGPSLMDVMTGYNATIAILAALSYRDHFSGKGQWLDISLMDSAVSCQTHLMAEYLLSGNLPGRKGNEGNGGGPAQVFECRDGHIYISAGTDDAYTALCKVLGAPELADDPRFPDVFTRGTNARDLTPLLSDLVAPWPKRKLMERLLEVDVPCSVVMDYDEVFADPHVRHRALRIELSHPAASDGTLSMVASPLRLSESPPVYERHPPMLGEHTDEVLRELLGVDDADLDRLRESRAI